MSTRRLNKKENVKIWNILPCTRMILAVKDNYEHNEIYFGIVYED